MDLQQIIILIVAGLIFLGKWFFENYGSASGGSEEKPPRRDREAPPLSGPSAEEERMRRFLEALGLPPEGAPPLPPQPKRPAAEQLPKPPVEPAEAPLSSQPTPRRRPYNPVEPRPWAARPKPMIRREPPAPAPAPAPTPQPVPEPEPSIFKPLEVSLAIPEIPELAPISQAAPKMELRHPASTPPGRQSPLRQALRDRASVRRALVLKEILGPPVALRSS